MTSLRVYGQAEVHAIHDIKQSGVPDFFTNLTFQPLNRADSQHGHSKITAESSRFGIETSTPLKVGTLNTKLEADFYAYSADTRNRLRLRQAYGEMGNWLIGKTWSTFMDLDNLPETVDFNGPIGAPFSRRAMIRYSLGDPKTGIKFSFAAEDPEDQFGGGSANERLPQLVIRMDTKFERVAVNVRALMHEKRSPTQTKHGYGVGVGANIKLTDNDVLMAQYTRVDGDIDQLYGANGYAIDAATGNISFDKNQGLVMGYAHIFDSQLRGNIAYGYNRGTSPQAADNRTLNQFFINLIYSPIKNVDIGGEFIQGKRKTFNGETGTLSRIDLMGRYSF